jgi:tRNA U34 5-carboxymethylaminomethyl modifying GTPase MnmE/TrmE
MLIQTAQHVSEIVGEIGTEDILNNIFANFCIGK